ncbi:hypothetical protein QQF64_019514 [Cirrhinus molitorella]|uniref:Immunoglobulin domain-containing protein n=1 Tax=Cirrhinus molitorella TaxID=172907 RepID=A0ABR3LJS0_9TELE
MKRLFNLLPVIVFVLGNGVSGFGSDVVPVSVKEGDLVMFKTGVKTKEQEDIKWYFKDTRIAQISGDLSHSCTDVKCEDGEEKFRDRLKLDPETGSLTITDISNTDSGLYDLKIISSTSSSDRIYNVTVNGSASKQYEMQRKSPNEGESLTLDPGETKNPNDVMTWYFNDTLIAEITRDLGKICADEQCKVRFRDRLKLNNQTGTLTIININITDSGFYKLQIIINNSHFSITSEERVKRFSVFVTAVPDSPESSSAVVGICAAVAVVLLVAVIAGLIFWCSRTNRYRQASQNDNDDNGSPLNMKDTLHP